MFTIAGGIILAVVGLFVVMVALCLVGGFFGLLSELAESIRNYQWRRRSVPWYRFGPTGKQRARAVAIGMAASVGVVIFFIVLDSISKR
jgi:hypothetical protein